MKVIQPLYNAGEKITVGTTHQLVRMAEMHLLCEKHVVVMWWWNLEEDGHPPLTFVIFVPAYLVKIANDVIFEMMDKEDDDDDDVCFATFTNNANEGSLSEMWGPRSVCFSSDEFIQQHCKDQCLFFDGSALINNALMD